MSETRVSWIEIALLLAIAAMIRMIATTISNSMSEKPFCLVIMLHILLGLNCYKGCTLMAYHYRRTSPTNPSKETGW